MRVDQGLPDQAQSFRLARVAVVLLVLVFVALRTAAAFGVDAPWIAPDEMLTPACSV